MNPEDVLIVGYGSPLNGDDSIGPRAARILARRGFRAIAVHQLTPELAERISRVGTVFFIDADMRVPPGEVTIEPVAGACGGGVLEHHATPEGLLDLARQVYQTAPAAWRVRIGGGDFGLGRPLSLAGRTGLATGVQEVAAAAAD
jgi:hydrogenase maturation protease